MKKKVILGSLFAVAVVAIAAIAFFAGKKSEETVNTKNTTENTLQSEDNTTQSATTVQESTEQEMEQEEKNVSDFSITYKASNSWQEDGKTCTQYDVTIANNTKEAADGWQAELTVPKGTKIVQSWNTSISRKGTKIITKPVDFNQTIEANKSVSYGMILKTKEAFKPEDSFVTVSGNSYAVNTSEEIKKQTEVKNDKEQEKTENKTLSKVDLNPVNTHGKLSVKGTDIVDEKGEKVQINGISTHGIAWFPEYVSEESFDSLKALFGINAIRLAMYSDPNAGYTKAMHEKVKQGVEAATKAGLYVIIDWHILNDNNPNQYKKQAKAFFEEMTKLYKDYNNVIYEICNEPNGDVTWERDIRPYATKMIKTIRKKDKDAIIIVGTPTWSQEVDKAAQNPIKNEKNIMYALHFYAATHKQEIRNKAQTALSKGLPIFVSEFSICEASGNGALDYDSAKEWMDFLEKNNIGRVAWNLSNKDEASSLLKSSCDKKSGYQKKDLSDAGQWLYQQYRKK